MIRYVMRAAALIALGGLAACAEEPTGGDRIVIDSDPFPSTYEPAASTPTAIIGATLLDGLGGRIDDATILMSDGDIVAVGTDVAIPKGATVIDGSAQWVTPGIIDVHSHLGIYPSPGLAAHSEGNESTDPVTAEVWAEHSVWPQDPGFSRALAGGVTAMQILPGSVNLFGGRSVTVKNVYARTVQGMKFPGAPHGLKMACGENPKYFYGTSRKRAPATRMGNVAGYRAAWAEAVDYKRDWDAYAAGAKNEPPKRDLELDTLKGVLDGDILVHMHCYRADEMAQILDMAEEFGYHVASFQHAVEAYKIADILAEHGTCSAMWADWWGFKIEAYDSIRENIPFVHAANACAIVHSDSSIGIQHLNQEAAKALADGNRVGLEIDKATAWIWLSANPAKSLGIFEATGSLEPGKDADVVLWSGDPFSSYTRAEKVFVDGAMLYDRNDPASWPVSDFELGQVGEGDAK